MPPKCLRCDKYMVVVEGHFVCPCDQKKKPEYTKILDRAEMDLQEPLDELGSLLASLDAMKIEAQIYSPIDVMEVPEEERAIEPFKEWDSVVVLEVKGGQVHIFFEEDKLLGSALLAN